MNTEPAWFAQSRLVWTGETGRDGETVSVAWCRLYGARMPSRALASHDLSMGRAYLYPHGRIVVMAGSIGESAIRETEVTATETARKHDSHSDDNDNPQPTVEDTMSTDIRDQLGGFSDNDLAGMGQAMVDGSGIQLPFRHLQAWAVNGDRKAKQFAQQNPVAYYGGWNVNADTLRELAEAGELQVPIDQTGWTHAQKSGRDGKDYETYETRLLHLAPIGRRLSWLSKDGKSRMPEYDVDHSRSHLQLLCLVGCTVKLGTEQRIAYVAPAVVSVKGKGQTEAIRDALSMWGRSIDGLRAGMNARGVPLFAWWMTIGTRGDADFVKVGQGANSSEVTPVKALMASEKLTAEQMGARFIGKDTFALAADLLSQATEWLAAWKTAGPALRPAADTDNGDNSSSGGGGSNYGEEVGPPDDDIPFVSAIDSARHDLSGRRVL